ncbi:hypothetical protein QAD02_021582 [Eretmocerus hayati]|uniref:Uncharacterized protein n=1 Tax=Eretmocerus hayati TaxID=131215 RepID=A0ACC2PT58_9HYME|nr:hypothetical protein QAD02_021582 [Eretmocerus hayati]
MSKMIDKMLKETIPNSKSDMEDNQDFIEKTKNLQIPEGYVMLKIDATSLYTNVGTHLVVRSVGRRFDKNLSSIIKKGEDRTDKWNQNNVVYKISCKDCDATYVGESKRSAKVRVKEHLGYTKGIDEKYVINKHIKMNTHEFDLEYVDILDVEKNWYRRILSEMIHIKSQRNPMNVKEDTHNLHKSYAPPLRKMKKETES